MPLPANTTTVVVLGTFNTPEGNPSTGTITFTPSAWLLNSGANIAIPNSGVTKTLGTAGNFSVTLPITDDADLSPNPFIYTVTEVIDGVSQSYNISIPGTVASGGTVYLADLAPVAAAGPEYYSLASSLSIGTVTTVATGGSATASITGLAPNQVLSLGIPVGATGNVASSGSGSVSAAAVYPTGDPDTGIYYPAANQVAITTGGTQALLLSGGAVSNPTFTGQVVTAAGTVSAPAISPTGDSNTGIFFPAADTVAIAEGGVEVLRVNSSGQIEHPAGSAAAPAIVPTGDTNTGLWAPAADTLAISTGGTERLRVDSSGRVGIGVSPNRTLAVSSSTAFQPQVGITSTNTDGNPPFLVFAKLPSDNSISAADGLGQINFQGTDTSGTARNAAAVASFATSQGSTFVEGNIGFNTTNSSGTFAEKMRIDGNGLITGTGTSLGAWTAYTPTLGGTGWALGNGTTVATYCQVGKIVHFRAIITFGTTSTFGATSTPTVSLPVTAFGANRYVFTAWLVDSSAAAQYSAAPWMNATTSVSMRGLGTNGQHTTITATAPFTWADADQIILCGTYEAA